MPADPVDALASVIANKPGAYCVVIGSGVSRAAGIPTAFEIILDLIRELAAQAGDVGNLSDDELVDWYQERFEALPDYSNLIEMLAPSPGDRLALLDRYFDPDEDDVQRGAKQPTKAHQAVANLVKMGLVRVLITTNFDRLMENALEEVGIQPTVAQSESDAVSLAPLHSIDCLLLKIHGDRRSPDFKNTTGELQEYSDGMLGVLGQILREYGLLVVGWSGDWDPALRLAMTENVSTVFSTFFAHRSDPSDVVAELLHTRHATPIQIQDADQLLSDLVERVSAIESLRASPGELDLASIKRLIPYPEHRIRLQDAMERSATDLADRTTTERFPLTLSEGSWQDIVDRYDDLVQASLPAAAVFAGVAYYGDEDRHRALVRKELLKLAVKRTDSGGVVDLINAQAIPASVCLYAAGVGWHASGDTGYFVRTAELIRTHDGNGYLDGPLKLNSSWAVSGDALHNADYFDGARKKTAASVYLAELLKPAIQPVVQEDFDDLFDDVEYLLGLVTFGEFGRASVGRWRWRDQWSDPPTRVNRFERVSDDLVDAGACGGDADALSDLHTRYEDWIQETRMYR